VVLAEISNLEPALLTRFYARYIALTEIFRIFIKMIRFLQVLLSHFQLVSPINFMFLVCLAAEANIIHAQQHISGLLN
jgi:hypothetical protein